jgi:hypothetical protein
MSGVLQGSWGIGPLVTSVRSRKTNDLCALATSTSSDCRAIFRQSFATHGYTQHPFPGIITAH